MSFQAVRGRQPESGGRAGLGRLVLGMEIADQQRDALGVDELP